MMIHDILKQFPFPPLATAQHVERNLQFCYSLMVATDRLLEEAGMTWKQDQERGHAEWLAQDLRTNGIEIPGYDYEAASIAGAQYYFIKHRSPLMLLGYCAALECRPPLLEHVKLMEAMVGPLPSVRHHAIHDIMHGKELVERIEAIDDEDLKLDIYRNARDTASRVSGVLTIRLYGHEKEAVTC